MEKNHIDNDAKIVQDKLSFKGAETLSDSELLAILLGRGEVKEQCLVKTSVLLSQNITLDKIFDRTKAISISNIAAVNNLIKVVGELSVRVKGTSSDIDVINNNHDVDTLMRPLLQGATAEEFWIITLNRAAHIIDKRCLSQGGIHSSIVDLKLMMKYVIDTLASSVIVVHNHPSGATEPSTEDLEVTKKILSALAFFDIKLLDHIIIGKENSFSFREKGLL